MGLGKRLLDNGSATYWRGRRLRTRLRVRSPPTVRQQVLREQSHRAEIIGLVFKMVHSLRKDLRAGGMAVHNWLDRFDVEGLRPMYLTEAKVGRPNAAHGKGRQGFKRSDVEKVQEGNDVSKKENVPRGAQGTIKRRTSDVRVVHLAREHAKSIYLRGSRGGPVYAHCRHDEELECGPERRLWIIGGSSGRGSGASIGEMVTCSPACPSTRLHSIL